MNAIRRPIENQNAIVKNSTRAQRTIFPLNIPIKNTCMAAELQCFTWLEIMPGDSIDATITGITRKETSIHPTMDTEIMSCDAFFVPNRLVWENWEEFITGGSEPSAWVQKNDLTIPQYTETNLATGELADILGLPLPNADTEIKEPSIEVSVLPYRGYYKIFNRYYRDENLEESLPEEMGDTCTIKYKKQHPAKLRDLITTLLPNAQKGPQITFGLSGNAPVDFGTKPMYAPVGIKKGGQDEPFYQGKIITGVESHAITEEYGDESKRIAHYFNGQSPSGNPHRLTGFSQSEQQEEYLKWANLQSVKGAVARLDEATQIGINEFRIAMLSQELLEALARGGSRYQEYISYIFNTTASDFRLQEPEFLNGASTPINMQEVTQGDAGGETPLGTTAGKSKTAGTLLHVKHSFVEHGILFFLYTIRNQNTYSQALDKKWTKKTQLEFYTPIMANIGELPMEKGEVAYIYGSEHNHEVMGYQKPWYEYTDFRAEAKGFFRTNVAENLATWYYGDLYNESPTLGSEFIKADKTNIQRTLAVQGNAHMYIGDYLISGTITRPIPKYIKPASLARN